MNYELQTTNYKLNTHNSSVFELWKEGERSVDVRIEGASMLPLIRPGDTVSLCLINGDELKKTGDLIAFRQHGGLIVHRFIKQRRINKSLWLCQKGDNLSGWSWILEDDVLGRVEAIRGRGKVIYLNTRPWTWINRVMGISWFLWISFVEKVRLSKVYAVVGRPLPALGGLAGRMGRALNSAYGYIVIKAIGGQDMMIDERQEKKGKAKEEKGRNTMPKYIPPKIVTYTSDEILEEIGPAMACSPSPCGTNP